MKLLDRGLLWSDLVPGSRCRSHGRTIAETEGVLLKEWRSIPNIALRRRSWRRRRPAAMPHPDSHSRFSSVPEIIRYRARQRPEATALVCAGRRATYRELDTLDGRISGSRTSRSSSVSEPASGAENMNLNNHVSAVVTGGTSGLGEASARLIPATGARGSRSELSK